MSALTLVGASFPTDVGARLLSIVGAILMLVGARFREPSISASFLTHFGGPDAVGRIKFGR